MTVGGDADVSCVSVNWAAEKPQQFEFVIVIIYVVITILHTY